MITKKIIVESDKSTNCKNKSELCYDLNLRLVYGMRTIGKVLSGAKILLGLLNLPPPPAKYSVHQKILANQSKLLSFESMKTAVEQAVLEINGSRDLCVAIDGSWQKRGHTSMNGIVTVTSVDTGKVLDYYCMSKYCRCPGKSNEEHLVNRSANYRGSSGGMEVEGV